jgi:hypothetical protein
MEALFRSHALGDGDRASFDRDGHLALPGLLTDEACDKLTQALARVQALQHDDPEYVPNRYAAEFNPYLESLIGHPHLLALVRWVLGEEIRYDHCVALNRPGGNGGANWHSHEYGEDDPRLGFIRVFFYVNGFEPDDGGLKVVRGSHLYRDAGIRASSNAELEAGWMEGKTHPLTGEALTTEGLSVPKGSVVLMWTHAAHGVTPRRAGSSTRWCVVYAYRNPGRVSEARWISESFEQKAIQGAEGLMSLY